MGSPYIILPEAPSAWIVNVGTELTLGVTVNTNGAWLARRLSLLGFVVKKILCVPDDEESVAEALKSAVASSVSLVVVTGGLGPTQDDATLEFASRALGLELEVNEVALQMVSSYYESRGMPMTPEREKMAKMPKGAVALPNPVGAAPGCLLELGKTTFVFLPGVPKEMEQVFLGSVERYLKAKFKLSPLLFEGAVKLRGVPESSLAPKLKEIASKHKHTYVKSHPRGSEVAEPLIEVHVITQVSKEELEQILDEVCKEAASLGGECFKEA